VSIPPGGGVTRGGPWQGAGVICPRPTRAPRRLLGFCGRVDAWSLVVWGPFQRVQLKE